MRSARRGAGRRRSPRSVFASRSRICVISTTPFSTATPKSAMKPTPAEIENGRPRRASAKTPPMAANGTFRKMSSGGLQRPEGEVEHGEDQGQRERHHDRQPPRGRLEVLELPAPADVVAGRQLHLAPDPLLRLGHERGHVAAAHVQLDHDPAPHRLAADLRRSRVERDLGELPERHQRARPATPRARSRGRRSCAPSRRRSGRRARSGAGPRRRSRRSSPPARPPRCRARRPPRCRSGRSGRGRP